jgi:hypothetical protein
MKNIIAILALTVATGVMAQPAKQPTPEKMAAAASEAKKEEPKKQETNCVTKDKKGNCPPAPKSEKPTPKKPVEKADAKAKAEAPKADAAKK